MRNGAQFPFCAQAERFLKRNRRKCLSGTADTYESDDTVMDEMQDGNAQWGPEVGIAAQVLQ